MTTEGRAPAERNLPLLRFLRSCERSVRIWLYSAGAGMVMLLFGINPSLLAMVAILGVIWVPILVLVFWGRLLDEMVFLRTDREDGPR